MSLNTLKPCFQAPYIGRTLRLVQPDRSSLPVVTLHDGDVTVYLVGLAGYILPVQIRLALALRRIL